GWSAQPSEFDRLRGVGSPDLLWQAASGYTLTMPRRPRRRRQPPARRRLRRHPVGSLPLVRLQGRHVGTTLVPQRFSVFRPVSAGGRSERLNPPCPNGCAVVPTFRAQGSYPSATLIPFATASITAKLLIFPNEPRRDRTCDPLIKSRGLQFLTGATGRQLA